MAQNDDQLQQQYQEILNKYASSIAATETVPTDQTLPVNPGSDQAEVTSSVTSEVISPPAVEIPQTVPPMISKSEVPPLYFPPEKAEPQKESNFFKYLFYVSLFIFFAVAVAVVYSFLNNQQADTNTELPQYTPSPTSVASKQYCEVGDQKYQIGDTFPSADECNSCSCTGDLTIACTQKACITPTPTTVKKVAMKTYKDTKYGYQFECPASAKYQIEATSVNGNKIPFKQETCTQGESVATISVYDNTVVHSFGDTVTRISPDKKYIFTFEGEFDDLLTSFKF